MDKNTNCTLTVFTPAYNRAHTLPRTYESLKRQSCKDFIWLIIDDGSTDGTAQLVQEWQSQDNGFEIQYIYKENGGMHTAHNTAYANIHTELNVCIDSDDWMTPTAVEDILCFWGNNKSLNYAGLIALDITESGELIGKTFQEGICDISFNDYFSVEGNGDKKLVYKTEIVKEFGKYPVFDGEKYFGLDWLYRKIDKKYSLLVLNKPICIVEYQADGSSATMYRQYIKNPKGFAFYRKEIMKAPRNSKELIKNVIHYISSSILAKNNEFILESPQKGLTVLLIPVGVILCLYIKWRNK